MVSILVPVYNYSIIGLAKELINQGDELDYSYEIIFLDDCSSDKVISLKNQSFCEVNNLTYIKSETNLGRAKARNHLAKKAKYEWILFLDSDVIPVYKNFLKTYISSITKDSSVLCGDIVYRKEVVNGTQILRWKYGTKYEEVSFEERMEKKHLHIKSANVCIRKEVFFQNEFPVLSHNYGFEDTLFGLILQEKNIDIELLENPVYHEGLESNPIFLRKTEEALKNLAEIIETNRLAAKQIRIAQFYLKLKKYNLEKVVKFFFRISKKKMERNLFSNRPNTTLFQFYKLGYLCEVLVGRSIS